MESYVQKFVLGGKVSLIHLRVEKGIEIALLMALFAL